MARITSRARRLADARVVLVALGATAGRSLFGPTFRVGSARGRTLELEGRHVMATIHPSAALRARSSEERQSACAGLVEDPRRAKVLAA